MSYELSQKSSVQVSQTELNPDFKLLNFESIARFKKPTFVYQTITIQEENQVLQFLQNLKY